MEVIQQCDQERIFFGSDFPCGGAETQRYELEKIKALGLSAKLSKRILYENIVRLLGLEVPNDAR